MESVRFEPDNCDTLCFGCHKWWEVEDREAYKAFKLKQLGQKRFDSLILQAASYRKKDRAMEYLKWSNEVKRILTSHNQKVTLEAEGRIDEKNK